MLAVMHCMKCMHELLCCWLAMPSLPGLHHLFRGILLGPPRVGWQLGPHTYTCKHYTHFISACGHQTNRKFKRAVLYETMATKTLYSSVCTAHIHEGFKHTNFKNAFICMCPTNTAVYAEYSVLYDL